MPCHKTLKLHAPAKHPGMQKIGTQTTCYGMSCGPLMLTSSGAMTVIDSTHHRVM